jgi:hypothetical protein
LFHAAIARNVASVLDWKRWITTLIVTVFSPSDRQGIEAWVKAGAVERIRLTEKLGS